MGRIFPTAQHEFWPGLESREFQQASDGASRVSVWCHSARADKCDAAVIEFDDRLFLRRAADDVMELEARGDELVNLGAFGEMIGCFNHAVIFLRGETQGPHDAAPLVSRLDFKAHGKLTRSLFRAAGQTQQETCHGRSQLPCSVAPRRGSSWHGEKSSDPLAKLDAMAAPGGIVGLARARPGSDERLPGVRGVVLLKPQFK